MNETNETNNGKMTVSVWRGRADGHWQDYEIEARANQTVLDAVTEVQRRHAPDLAYRFACRVGVCGSCAMTVNGKPMWTCRSHVRKVVQNGRIRVGPLRNLPHIKDLVADLAPFFDKWQAAGGRHRGSRDRYQALAAVSPQSPARQAADAGIECINCAVCYSACDTVAWRDNYVGPAALNRVWTIVNDVRHDAREAVLNQAFGEGGCSNCHSLGACTAACPQDLDPSAGIAALKRLGASRFWGMGQLP